MFIITSLFKLLVLLVVVAIAAVVLYKLTGKKTGIGKLGRNFLNMFRSGVDAAADATSDAVRDGKYAIEDAKKQMEGFEEEIRQVIIKQKLNRKRLTALEAEVVKFTTIAKEFADTDEASALDAIKKKQSKEKVANALKSELSKNEARIAELKKLRSERAQQIENAADSMDILAARKSAAEMEKDMVNAKSKFSGGSFSQLTELQEAVERSEADAEATKELADEDSGGALEKKYDDAQVDSSAANELAALKAAKAEATNTSSG